jgi:hypothetical protein
MPLPVNDLTKILNYIFTHPTLLENHLLRPEALDYLSLNLVLSIRATQLRPQSFAPKAPPSEPSLQRSAQLAVKGNWLPSNVSLRSNPKELI